MLLAECVQACLVPGRDGVKHEAANLVGRRERRGGDVGRDGACGAARNFRWRNRLGRRHRRADLAFEEAEQVHPASRYRQHPRPRTGNLPPWPLARRDPFQLQRVAATVCDGGAMPVAPGGCCRSRAPTSTTQRAEALAQKKSFRNRRVRGLQPQMGQVSFGRDRVLTARALAESHGCLRICYARWWGRPRLRIVHLADAKPQAAGWRSMAINGAQGDSGARMTASSASRFSVQARSPGVWGGSSRVTTGIRRSMPAQVPKLPGVA